MVRVPPRTLGMMLVSAAMLTGVLGGTSAIPPATFTSLPPLHEYVPSDWDLERRQELLAGMAAESGLTEPPEVAIVRWVNPEDSSGVMVECLHAAGSPVKQESDGYSFETYEEDQQGAYALANYVCTAQYPVRLDIDRPLSDEEHDGIYRHLVDVFLPCADQHGYTGLSTPSREVYARAMRGETLDPVYVQLTHLTNYELESLLQACELRPPGLRSHEA